MISLLTFFIALSTSRLVQYSNSQTLFFGPNGESLKTIIINLDSQKTEPQWIWAQGNNYFTTEINLKLRCLSKPIRFWMQSMTGCEVTVFGGTRKYEKNLPILFRKVPLYYNVSCGEDIKIFINVSNSSGAQGLIFAIQQQECCENNIGGMYFSEQNCKCQSLCGDSVLVPFVQECDDGNLIDGDGCDASCKIQKQFNCSVAPFEQSICQSSIHIKVLSIMKNTWQNKFNLSIKISPNFLILSNINFTNCITAKPYNQYSIIILSHSFDDEIITLQCSYKGHLNYQKVQFSLNSSAFHYLSSAKDTFVSFTVRMKTSNNLALNQFSQSTYQRGKTFKIVYKICVYIIYIMLIVGIFESKMIGIEMIWLLQISFMSTNFSRGYNPLTYAMVEVLRQIGWFRWIVHIDQIQSGSGVNEVENFWLSILPLILVVLLFMSEKIVANLKNNRIDIVNKKVAHIFVSIVLTVILVDTMNLGYAFFNTLSSKISFKSIIVALFYLFQGIVCIISLATIFHRNNNNLIALYQINDYTYEQKINQFIVPLFAIRFTMGFVIIILMVPIVFFWVVLINTALFFFYLNAKLYTKSSLNIFFSLLFLSSLLIAIANLIYSFQFSIYLIYAQITLVIIVICTLSSVILLIIDVKYILKIKKERQDKQKKYFEQREIQNMDINNNNALTEKQGSVESDIQMKLRS